MLDHLFTSPALVGVLASVHGAAFATSTPAFLLRRPSWKRLGLGLFFVAFAINTALIVGRWIESDRPPFKTLYETMLFYPWCVGLVTFALVYLHRLSVLVPFSACVSLAGLVYALVRPDAEIVNLPPALQSAWFIPHVVTYFVAYAALFASFALAVLALCLPRWQSSAPSTTGAGPAPFGSSFAAHAHHAAVFGTCALTLGLVMGAAWGKYAWGDYWGWDPKENWALVTWLAYVVYLHLRLMEGWHGRRAMAVLVAAFAAVVFTYLGMSLLPTASGSLHVYQ